MSTTNTVHAEVGAFEVHRRRANRALAGLLMGCRDMRRLGALRLRGFSREFRRGAGYSVAREGPCADDALTHHGVRQPLSRSARCVCRPVHRRDWVSRRAVDGWAREVERDASAGAYPNNPNCPGGQGRGGARAPCRSSAMAPGSVTSGRHAAGRAPRRRSRECRGGEPPSWRRPDSRRGLRDRRR